MPARYQEWKASVRAGWGSKMTEGSVSVWIHLAGELRGDLDNYAKSVLDALSGVAFEDDDAGHVTSLHVRRTTTIDHGFVVEVLQAPEYP